jgi:aminocarboxymuconate-semialdehyde decarboxylase
MTGTQASEDPATVVIDAHAHIVPPALLESLPSEPPCSGGFAARQTEQGWVVSVPGFGDTRPIGKRMIDSKARRAWQAGTGITKQVVSPWMDIQTGELAPPAARDWSRRVNDAMCESVAEFGADCTALATVDITDGEHAAADLEQAWKQPEFVGLMLSTNPLGGRQLHDRELDPLWALAEQERIPVMLHPPTCGPSGSLSTLGRMGNVHGRLVDNTIAITELILHGLLDRHPELRIILVHGGGFLPYQAGRLDGGYRTKEAFVAPLERAKPSDYLDAFYYDTVGLSGAAVAFLAGLAGPERVLLGSDFPFALGDPQPVRTVREAGLAEEAVEAILHGNSAELFGADR